MEEMMLQIFNKNDENPHFTIQKETNNFATFVDTKVIWKEIAQSCLLSCTNVLLFHTT